MSDDEKDTKAEDVEEEDEDKGSKGKGKGAAGGKKFEVKKWNAVALWAWGTFETTLRH